MKNQIRFRRAKLGEFCLWNIFPKKTLSRFESDTGFRRRARSIQRTKTMKSTAARAHYLPIWVRARPRWLKSDFGKGYLARDTNIKRIVTENRFKLPTKSTHCSSHKKPILLLLLILWLISIILIVQTVYCLLNTSDFPTTNLKDKIPLRSRPELDVPLASASFSSVTFINASIKAKQTYEVNLISLRDAQIQWACEVCVTTENAKVEWMNTTFLGFEDVTDLEVSLDGKPLGYSRFESGGKEYYSFSGFNLTQKNEIRTLQLSCRIRREPYPNVFTRIPWLFNENYSQFINFPIGSIPVETNNKSAVSTLRVVFSVPFRTILTDQSGWMDAFVPPQSEWVLTDPKYNTYRIELFEYPISQNSSKETDVYSFTTYFSQDNVANITKIVLVPNIEIPIFLLFLLSSPIYITVLEPFMKKVRMHKTKLNRVKDVIMKIFQLYSIPIITFTMALLVENFNLAMLLYLLEIVNPFVLIFVLIYPLLYAFPFFYLRKRI